MLDFANIPLDKATPIQVQSIFDTLVVQKDLVPKNSAQVELYLDTSGSMNNIARKIPGAMRVCIQFADVIDQDKKLAYYTFSSDLSREKTLTIADSQTDIMPSLGGSTNTAACVKNAISNSGSTFFGNLFSVFGKKKTEKKTLAIIITDGEPDSIQELEEECNKLPSNVFVQFVCIGNFNLFAHETSAQVDSQVIENISSITVSEFISKIVSDDLVKFLNA